MLNLSTSTIDRSKELNAKQLSQPENSKDDSRSNLARKRLAKVTEINYQRNIDSDYTEKIEALDSSFDYERDRNHWWGDPELSILHGTPLYEQASETQRLALNHLYWAIQYNQTAATEANAVLYNQVTADVFSAVGGYSALCEELTLETEQERHHIHAFHNIGYKTKKALLGASGFNNAIRSSARQKSGTQTNRQGVKQKIGQRNASQQFGKVADALSRKAGFSAGKQDLMPAFQDSAFRFATRQVVLRDQSKFYSEYLRANDEKGLAIPAQTTGLLGQIAPKPFLQFFTLNCGSSPFIACVFYATRFMANMLLKNYEYRYVKFHRKLERQGQFIPTPTAVSTYHLMDEAFHTTTSQLIAQDLYKAFPKPTAYEKWVANSIIYRAQTVALSGLSGGLPAIFRSDASLMDSYYQLLQSPVFNFTPQESLHWIERCLCHETDGLHQNLEHHHHLRNDLRRHFEPMDYLWPVNRDVRVMAAGGSVEKAVKNNIKAFRQFSKSVAVA